MVQIFVEFCATRSVFFYINDGESTRFHVNGNFAFRCQKCWVLKKAFRRKIQSSSFALIGIIFVICHAFLFCAIGCQLLKLNK